MKNLENNYHKRLQKNQQECFENNFHVTCCEFKLWQKTIRPKTQFCLIIEIGTGSIAFTSDQVICENFPSMLEWTLKKCLCVGDFVLFIYQSAAEVSSKHFNFKNFYFLGHCPWNYNILDRYMVHQLRQISWGCIVDSVELLTQPVYPPNILF